MPSPLPTRLLGRTPFELTRVGLGAWAIGGGGYQGSWGPQDDDESIATIHRAVADGGVNWIDTAAAYGLGHSEQVVGRAVAALRPEERPLVFTKCGLVWGEGTTFTNVLAPDSIRRECDASQRRLGLDHVDVYFMHWPSWDGTPVEESWAAMAELVDEGKVRAIGLSNFDLADVARCHAVRPVDVLQPELNLLSREAAGERLRWAAQNGAGVVTYSPMASGLLTGSFNADGLERLAGDDWRRGHPNFQQPAFGRNLELVERLRAIADDVGCTLAELAVAWVLAWPAVTGAIVGARTPGEVDGWIGAAYVELGEDVLAAIAAALEELEVGTGPRKPEPPREQGFPRWS
ncbi:MAG TPA: aldo/keto reductase [Gaiellaceae bacterium]|nr:aldo/keto reductase [Gaiellaceae bacterium]